ncbi:MAG: magnesium/cobalt transporter CorA [Desulfobacterales bacterium]|nr:magnesium/cobalt transporter CorA [Desulfobacterales bacterium]
MRITCIDYCPEQFQILEIKDLPTFIKNHRPIWSRVRWINIEGISQPDAIHQLAQKYQLHPLAIEDIFHTIQRPKVEDYPNSGNMPGRLFVVARSAELQNDILQTEQMCFFLGRTTLLTFQQTYGDIFDPIRNRIKVSGSRLRENDGSFLLYSLIDAIVDSYFPILERYSGSLEDIEEEMMAQTDQLTLKKLHRIKRELLILRRTAWPMRELVSMLQREKHECLSEITNPYFRDVYDHCMQIIDLIETYREISASLTDMNMSAISNRMNEIMKLLTIIGTIFIPLTFLAGVYGMNMPIPENRWAGTYPLFWILCLTISGVMLYYFSKRKWI